MPLSDADTPRELFSSPSMRARAYQVRLLSLVDELERAWARRDYWAARAAAAKARDLLPLVEQAWRESETWADQLTDTQGRAQVVSSPTYQAHPGWADQDHPTTESEHRLLDGNR